jgi:hypothetical protein
MRTNMLAGLFETPVLLIKYNAANVHLGPPERSWTAKRCGCLSKPHEMPCSYGGGIGRGATSLCNHHETL